MKSSNHQFWNNIYLLSCYNRTKGLRLLILIVNKTVWTVLFLLLGSTSPVAKAVTRLFLLWIDKRRRLSGTVTLASVLSLNSPSVFVTERMFGNTFVLESVLFKTVLLFLKAFNLGRSYWDSPFTSMVHLNVCDNLTVKTTACKVCVCVCVSILPSAVHGNCLKTLDPQQPVSEQWIDKLIMSHTNIHVQINMTKTENGQTKDRFQNRLLNQFIYLEGVLRIHFFFSSCND